MYRILANDLRLMCAKMADWAGSGHLGMPLGMADVATVLWLDFMKWNNSCDWSNRDRFILSCGHGSALLYSIMYFIGIISLEDCKQFRKFGSITPGHPEKSVKHGIEMTTGPLGQGLAWGIGMAYSSGLYPELDYYTYIFCSDGDLMEGISHESIALAKVLNCKRCIVFWDDNGVTIDGAVSASTFGDLGEIFKCHGWEIFEVDGHNHDAIREVIVKAKSIDGPSCIRCKTKIGLGLKEVATNKAHSCKGDLKYLKDKLQINYDEIPEEHLAWWRRVKQRGAVSEMEWRSRYPNFEIKSNIDLNKCFNNTNLNKVSTRSLIGAMLAGSDGYIVGSADLGDSTYTSKYDNYINFGVREHAMVAIMGGMSLCGEKVVAATFLAFIDYARPAIRLAALMKTKLIIVATHDSIATGEDGPTHQPIEQLNSYRLMPNVRIWRPANVAEMCAAWVDSIDHNGPTVIACSRQEIEMFQSSIENCAMGGYIVVDCPNPQITIIATGSEVKLAMEAAKLLHKIEVRVVSMPCVELFDAQEYKYKQNLLCGSIVSIEAGSTGLWHKYADLCIGIDTYGASGSWERLMQEYGFSPEVISKKILTYLATCRGA